MKRKMEVMVPLGVVQKVRMSDLVARGERYYGRVVKHIVRNYVSVRGGAML